MALIAEAWSVLSNPQSRRAYDQSRKTTPDPQQAEHSAVPQQYFVPARFPWRMVLTFIFIGIIVVLVLNALSGPGIVRGPDGLLQGGSCVVLDEAQTVSEVDCAVEHFGVVSQIVGFDMTCPSDQETFRDRQGMGLACVVLSK
jgi:molecular chaperone DnaJ